MDGVGRGRQSSLSIQTRRGWGHPSRFRPSGSRPVSTVARLRPHRVANRRPIASVSAMRHRSTNSRDPGTQSWSWRCRFWLSVREPLQIGSKLALVERQLWPTQPSHPAAESELESLCPWFWAKGSIGKAWSDQGKVHLEKCQPCTCCRWEPWSFRTFRRSPGYRGRVCILLDSSPRWDTKASPGCPFGWRSQIYIGLGLRNCRHKASPTKCRARGRKDIQWTAHTASGWSFPRKVAHSKFWSCFRSEAHSMSGERRRTMRQTWRDITTRTEFWLACWSEVNRLPSVGNRLHCFDSNQSQPDTYTLDALKSDPVCRGKTCYRPVILIFEVLTSCPHNYSCDRLFSVSQRKPDGQPNWAWSKYLGCVKNVSLGDKKISDYSTTL